MEYSLECALGGSPVFPFPGAWCSLFRGRFLKGQARPGRLISVETSNMEQDYPEELGPVDESTLEERLSLRCDSLVKAGVAPTLRDHLSQLDSQLSLAAANVDLSVFEAKVEIEKEFSSELQMARKEIVGLREQVKSLGEPRVDGGPSINPEVTTVPPGNDPGVHPLAALEGHLVRMSLAGGTAKDPAPAERETAKDNVPTKPTTEGALTKSTKRRLHRKAKKPLQERHKAAPDRLEHLVWTGRCPWGSRRSCALPLQT